MIFNICLSNQLEEPRTAMQIGSAGGALVFLEIFIPMLSVLLSTAKGA